MILASIQIPINRRGAKVLGRRGCNESEIRRDPCSNTGRKGRSRVAGVGQNGRQCHRLVVGPQGENNCRLIVSTVNRARVDG